MNNGCCLSETVSRHDTRLDKRSFVAAPQAGGNQDMNSVQAAKPTVTEVYNVRKPHSGATTQLYRDHKALSAL
jgi:hypothetical protein